MRLLFLILLLANVALYAYAYATQSRNDDALRMARLQMHPEKIRIAKPGGAAAPAAPAPASAVPEKAAVAPPAACLQWGMFAGPAVARAADAIAKLGLPEGTVQRAVVDSGGFWVYIPPLKNKAEIDQSVASLKASGITDYFVVQGQTESRNAISLGIFSSQDAANSFLADLRGKGVNQAVVGRRENFLKQVAFFVREPGETVVAALAGIQREFAGSEVKAVACPAPETAGQPVNRAGQTGTRREASPASGR